MAEILLVRHGEVVGNHANERLVFSGWNDVPLTERGKLQAQSVGKYLQSETFAAVYSSDLQRARETALPIAREHGLQVLADRRLRELNFGAWSGCGERELLENWPDLWAQRQANPENVRPPDGENLRDLGERVQTAWREIVHSHPHENVVIVAHQGSIRAVLLDILGANLSRYRALRIANGSVSRVQIDGEMALVIGVNDVSHLQDI